MRERPALLRFYLDHGSSSDAQTTMEMVHRAAADIGIGIPEIRDIRQPLGPPRPVEIVEDEDRLRALVTVLAGIPGIGLVTIERMPARDEAGL